VILLVLIMPVMDGFAVLGQLKANHPPVIVVIGATSPLSGMRSPRACCRNPSKGTS
jgi:CheY-like chemotaxis protein